MKSGARVIDFKERRGSKIGNDHYLVTQMIQKVWKEMKASKKVGLEVAKKL